MRLIMDFDVCNDFVSNDATIIYRFSEDDVYRYSMFDTALITFEEIFEHVVDPYDKEEVLNFYELTRKSKAFEGSKNIP